MNTASEPYRTALLITMSISYSRYFSTAMAMAAYRHRNARFSATLAATEFVTIAGIIAATSSSVAAANHFSCSRSSPVDRANLATTAARLTTSVRGTRMSRAIITSWFSPWVNAANGSSQTRVARTSRTTAVNTYAAPTNQAAGSHRRERSRPVGKSMSRKASSAIWTTQVQLENQATSWPAGRDPGATRRACSAYGAMKAPSPSVTPAARNSQPMRFDGRREARTNPTTGTPMFPTSWRTAGKLHPVRSAGRAYRSAYARAIPAAIKASEPTAMPPATHPAVRALIWIPPAPGFALRGHYQDAVWPVPRRPDKEVTLQGPL